MKVVTPKSTYIVNNKTCICGCSNSTANHNANSTMARTM
jgi:hypothetical protein